MTRPAERRQSGLRPGPVGSLADANRRQAALAKWERRLRSSRREALRQARMAQQAAARKAREAHRLAVLDHKQALRRRRWAEHRRMAYEKQLGWKVRHARTAMSWHARQLRRWEARIPAAGAGSAGGIRPPHRVSARPSGPE